MICNNHEKKDTKPMHGLNIPKAWYPSFVTTTKSGYKTNPWIEYQTVGAHHL